MPYSAISQKEILCSALATAQLERVGFCISPVDERLGGFPGSSDKRLQVIVNFLVRSPLHPIAESLILIALCFIKGQQFAYHLWDLFRRKRHELLAKPHAAFAYFAPEQKLIERRLLVADLADVSVETNVAKVVLSARV